MMSLGSDASFPYYQGDGFQAVALPYVGGQVSMLVLIPDEGISSDFEDGFSRRMSWTRSSLILRYTPLYVGISPNLNLSPSSAWRKP